MEAAFDAFNDRNFDQLVELCHPEVEWTPPAELPGSRTYHGHDGVREAVEDMVSIFTDLRAEPVRLEERGDTVIGLYLWRGTGGSSGASLDPFEVQAGFVAEFQNDKVRVARFWTNWESALEAGGLEA